MSKILHLKSSYGFWGPDRQVLQMAKAMCREGFQTEILVLYRRQGAAPLIHPLVEEARGAGLKAEQLDDKAKFSLGTIFYIARKLRSERFALIHTHDYKGNALGGIAAKLAGVKIVSSARGYTERSLPLKIYKAIDLLILRFVSRVIAVSESLRQQLIAAGLPEERVVTIYNAIDVEAFTSETLHRVQGLRDQLGIDDGQHVISIIGRLTPEKGHRYFLESARYTLKTLPGARFLVIGDGPLREQLEDFSASLGLNHAVSFLGYQRDIAAFMSISDIIVISSVREGLPNVLLEALALAKPVVATQVGGISEVLQDRETGLLVPPKDSRRLAEAIIYVLRNPKEAANLGARGKRLVSREFSVNRMAQKVAQVYRDILSEG